MTITAVGGTPVVLVDHQTLLVPGRDPVTLPEASQDAVLQQPSTAGDAVIVQTGRALYSVPLQGASGGSAEATTATTVSSEGSGSPAEPVALAGCVYAVWSGVPRLVTGCGAQGAKKPRAQAVGAAPGAHLRLRVNRSRVVLNDPDTGDTFLPDDPKVSIAQWDVVGHSTKDPRSRTDQQTSERLRLADRKSANRPPQPQPDAFGVRPGATVVLPVLDNDTDPDGDVLTARPPTTSPPTGFGQIQTVTAGRALQFTATGQSGSQTLEYGADDGRPGGVATSRAKLSIIPLSVNTAPRLVTGAPVVAVGRAGRVSYDVLRDWRDPEGDPLTLSCPGTADGAVRCSPDGALTYTDSGRQLGRVKVSVQVSDGRARADGAIVIDVVADRPPLVRPDFGAGVVGTPVVLRPLLNDTAYSTAPLQLTRVTPTDATTSAAIQADGGVAVTASASGSIYLTYQVAAGEATGTGLIRVDVAAAKGNRPPVAAPDSVLVRPLVPQVVDVLANDTDPDGDVLVVTGATAGQPGAGLSVEVLSHRTVRVTAAAGFSGPVSIRYTVSDGGTEVRGTLLVRRAADNIADASPLAKDDVGSVRVGLVTTVPVLTNDSDPEGEPLRLDPQLRNVSFRPAAGAASGKATALAFTTGDTVRVVAPNAPGTVTLTYTARDSRGQPGSATLTVRVTPQGGPNTAPVPVPLEARAIAGRPTSIVVPLAGIDADGDPVRLVAPAKQPRSGVLELDPSRGDALRYTPRPDARGADQVIYQVADAFGLTSTAAIRIGIAPPPVVVSPPVAVPDTVAVRNDRPRRVQVAVLANDTSAAGGPVTLAATQAITPLTAGAQVRVHGSAVEVSVAKGSTAPILTSYRIEADGMPGAAPGLLTVSPSADAPLLPPVARDDVASPAGAPGSAVSVPVLANDTDPDGTPAELRLASDAEAVGPTGLATRLDNRTLRVTPAKDDRWAWYTVVDGDGQRARALVLVRGTEGPPRLKPGAPAFTVVNGQTRSLALADYVESPGGRAVRLADLTHTSGSGVTVRATSATALAVTGATAYGPGAVTFEVMDGASAAAAGVHRAYLTVPVTVLSKDNRSPRLRPLVLTVNRGGPGATADLEAATDDDPADAGRHTYRVGRVTGGVSATMSGRRLTVGAGSASASSAGTLAPAGQVTVEVGDGRATGSGTVSVIVVEGAATPPPQAADCSPVSGMLVDPGSSFSIDLARCTANPGGGALRATVSASSLATASVSGLSVSVSVPATARGAVSLPYTVTDASGRGASARITARAVGKPTAPGAPQTTGSTGGASVLLRWTAADAQGGTITEYRVRAAGVAQTCSGDATQCQITGLDPAQSYTFTVSAVNERGEGPASPPSTAVRADSPPDPPSGVTARAGDGSATVSWTGANGTGSPITGYTVGISPATSDGRVSITVAGGAGSVSTTVSGLTNGTSYTFTVRARNASQLGLSQPSSSAPVVPVGPVRTPPTPTATISGTGQATVSWSASAVTTAANGQLTRLVVNDNGTAHDVTGSAASGSTTFAVTGTGTHSFSLTVTNGSGSSATGASVTAAYAAAPAVPTLASTENGVNPVGAMGEVRLVVGNVAPTTGSVQSITISWGGGSASVPPATGTATTTVTVSGGPTSATFTAEVCNSGGRCTSSVPLGPVPIYGVPVSAQISLSHSGLTVTASWGSSDHQGNPSRGTWIGLLNVVDGNGQSVSACSRRVTDAPGSCSFTGTAGTTYTASYYCATYDYNIRGNTTTDTITLPAATPTPTPTPPSTPPPSSSSPSP